MRTTILRLLACLGLLAALGLGLAGCNTVHGVGKDVEAFGEWMQDEAADW